jgi:iron complex transport system substrate-binding protein
MNSFFMDRTLQRILLILMLAGAVSATMPASEYGTRTVTDTASRRGTLPNQIHKIYCLNPACAMLIYTLAPERLMGWSLQLNQKERSYLAPPYDRLPGQSGLGENIEQLIKIHPDVIMMMSNAADSSLSDRLQKIQEQTHIPTFVVDMRMQELPQTYEQLGALLGTQAHAGDLARYCRNTLEEVESGVKAIPMSLRPRVYYAGGVNGLQTLPTGSILAESIAVAGGINVAQMPMTQNRGQASIEQIVAWRPDYVIVATDRDSISNEFYRHTIWNDPLWGSLPAVQNHAVYVIPPYPFGWVSPPGSINRILGIKWLASLFYPNRFRYDMRKEAREFYALFYHKQLSEAELNELLEHAHR